MAIGDISPFALIMVTPGSTATLIATVPANEEWKLQFARGVCLIASGGTAPTISLGLSSAANELCYNEVVSIPTADTVGAKNIVGPDWLPLPPGTPIYARASTASAVRLLIAGMREQVA